MATKEEQLRAFNQIRDTIIKLNGNCPEITTWFENFNHAYGFGESGFCYKSSIISDQKYIEYSDERVTETDILNMIDSTIAILRKIIEKKMLDEEEKKRQAQIDKRMIEEISRTALDKLRSL